MGVFRVWTFFSFEDWSHLAYLELMDMEGMDGERAADNFRVGYANHDGSRRRVIHFITTFGSVLSNYSFEGKWLSAWIVADLE
jgi:hypothetical protein